MVLYLAMPLLSGNQQEISGIDTSTVHTAQNTPASDAYVIVTVNKKHFLTRFPSYIPVELTAPMERVTTRSSVERVQMKIKPAKYKRKVEDFSIKPAPLE